MEINLFGRKIIFELKYESDSNKNNQEKKESFNRFIFRFILLTAIFFIFGVWTEYKEMRTTYEIGKVAENDVIAYKDMKYYIDLLDPNLERKIRENTNPEYDRIDTVEEEQIQRLNNFFQDARNNVFETNEEKQEYLKENGYNLTVEEYDTIGNKESLTYIMNMIEELRKIYSIGIVQNQDFNDNISKINISLSDEDKKLLSNFITPNLILNEEKTREKIEQNMSSLRNKEMNIYKGDIIVRKGEIIDSDAYEKLEKLNLVRGGDVIIKVFGLMFGFVMLMSVLYTILNKYFKKMLESNIFYPTIFTILIINFIYVFLENYYIMYLLPIAMLPMILTIIGNKMYALSISLFNTVILSRDETWIIIMMVVMIITVYKADKITSRSDIVKIGIFTGIVQSIWAFIFGLINQLDFPVILLLVVFSVMSGIFTGMLSLGLLPYYENTFEILTDIKLLEISNFSSPLLKQLLITAPGTFHHSMMVGALAEAGAEAIGANAIFARVSSYYHDIGKMKRPEFFVENQKNGVNMHDSIKPSLSALLITSHTKDGQIMGKQYKLPKEIQNVILSHHGTTLVQFFYYKALENGEDVIESDFRYSGPKPVTKEETIVMLADTVEAAVRSSSNKSKESIENLTRYLVNYKIEDNQLSDSELTMGEIEKIIQAFVNTLQGIYHDRIKYPKLDNDKKNEK